MTKNEINLREKLRLLTIENRELKKDVKKYKYDKLTGLEERVDFRENIDLKIKEKIPFFISMVDINDLHSINKDHGYRAGDKVIKEVGKTIEDVMDGYENCSIYRIGGDEFIVMSESDISSRLGKIWKASFCIQEFNNQTFEEIFDKIDACLIERKKYKVSIGEFKERRKKKTLLIDKIYRFLYGVFYADRRAHEKKCKSLEDNIFKN